MRKRLFLPTFWNFQNNPYHFDNKFYCSMDFDHTISLILKPFFVFFYPFSPFSTFTMKNSLDFSSVSHHLTLFPSLTRILPPIAAQTDTNIC